MLRRALAKRPELEAISKHNLDLYISNKYNGTNCLDVDMDNCESAPPPGAPYRGDWAPYYPPFGPIGLILVQLHEKATSLERGFRLHRFG